ncbi:MAG: Undecaprenyl-diphosphatase [Candidatus Omnitrophica bacterium ADurb.Bin277]|nr:MAG: Undecaprenyl-diphosphatase [Candidatus Omnitrophica bacterium ADurb.Bin277]
MTVPEPGLDIIKSVILGVVQGITEFLPVSSSGHLVLFQTLFGMKESMLSFDIAVHAGTLLAVLIYFRKDLFVILADFGKFFLPCVCARGKPGPQKLWFYIFLTLVPTGMAAVLFKSKIEAAFSDLGLVAVAWLVMGCVLILSRRFQDGRLEMTGMGWLRAVGVGTAQAVALLPGISRSGSTILGGMVCGLRREDAAKFSFLISIPAILAAIVMDLKDGGLSYFTSHAAETVFGFLAAFISGYVVIRWFMGVIQKGKLFIFGYYCLAVGLLSLVLVKYIL